MGIFRIPIDEDRLVCTCRFGNKENQHGAFSKLVNITINRQEHTDLLVVTYLPKKIVLHFVGIGDASDRESSVGFLDAKDKMPTFGVGERADRGKCIFWHLPRSLLELDIAPFNRLEARL